MSIEISGHLELARRMRLFLSLYLILLLLPPLLPFLNSVVLNRHTFHTPTNLVPQSFSAHSLSQTTQGSP